MRKLSRTSIIAGGVVATSLAGVAFAAWTSTGSGTGSAASDAISNVTYAATTPAGVTLYPTGPAADVTFLASNPNKYKVTLSAFSMSGAYYSTDTSHTTDVTATCGLSFSTTDTPTVAGLAAGTSVSLPGSLTMSNSAVNACANKTFDIVLTSTATSTP
jgi:hypothetical protein